MEEMRDAVEALHHCSAVYTGSFPVHAKVAQGEVWDGVVEAFLLVGHEEAERCYAWSCMEGGERRYIAILEVPPVSSPESAVRKAMADDQQQ